MILYQTFRTFVSQHSLFSSVKNDSNHKISKEQSHSDRILFLYFFIETRFSPGLIHYLNVNSAYKGTKRRLKQRNFQPQGPSRSMGQFFDYCLL